LILSGATLEERGDAIDLDQFSAIDQKRSDILQEVETLRSDRNSVSKEIGKRKKNGEDASGLITEMGSVSSRIKELDESLKKTEELLNGLIMTIPNIPHESVVCGTGDEDNPVVRKWVKKPQFDFEPRPHWDIGEDLNILDFAAGAKIAGARFTVSRGAGARLGKGADKLHARSSHDRTRLYRDIYSIHGEQRKHDGNRSAPQI